VKSGPDRGSVAEHEHKKGQRAQRDGAPAIQDRYDVDITKDNGGRMNQ
jgi:hypothetical protein